MDLKFNACGFTEEETKHLEELYADYAKAKMAFMRYFQEIIARDFTLELGEK